MNINTLLSSAAGRHSLAFVHVPEILSKGFKNTALKSERRMITSGLFLLTV